MLEIINSLKPFFEDCYTELGVREYSRKIKVSPPTASKMLKEFESEGFLNKRIERGYLLFRTNKENLNLKTLSKILIFFNNLFLFSKHSFLKSLQYITGFFAFFFKTFFK